jgi:hypothetical protein
MGIISLFPGLRLKVMSKIGSSTQIAQTQAFPALSMSISMYQDGEL